MSDAGGGRVGHLNSGEMATNKLFVPTTNGLKTTLLMLGKSYSAIYILAIYIYIYIYMGIFY